MASTSCLLRVRLVDAPRFVFRTGTDSVYAFRSRFERFREPGESLVRIESDFREHLRMNWSGTVPPILIFGDSPDKDTRAQGTLVLGVSSSTISDDGIGRSASLVEEVVETRIRTQSREALRDAAFARLEAAFQIVVLTTYKTDLQFPFLAPTSEPN